MILGIIFASTKARCLALILADTDVLDVHKLVHGCFFIFHNLFFFMEQVLILVIEARSIEVQFHFLNAYVAVYHSLFHFLHLLFFDFDHLIMLCLHFVNFFILFDWFFFDFFIFLGWLLSDFFTQFSHFNLQCCNFSFFFVWI